jgi:hypothetical protein
MFYVHALRCHRNVSLMGCVVFAAGCAQPGIKLDGVPDRLTFPSRDQTNRYLTAEVVGGSPNAVWIALEDDSTKKVAFSPTGLGRFQINLADTRVGDLVPADGQTHALRVIAEMKDGTVVTSAPILAKHENSFLDLGDGIASLVLPQRSSREIPGSRGSLRVMIGDISGGRVLVTVFGPGGRTVVPTTPIRRGESIPLTPVNDGRYVIGCDRLVNLLAGDDYAEFTVARPADWTRKRIDDLLLTIERSGVTFVRNDQELTPRQFADWLRTKRDYSRGKFESLDDFIERLGSKSIQTGKPYLVKLPDGTTMEAGPWLYQQAGLEIVKGAPTSPESSNGD